MIISLNKLRQIKYKDAGDLYTLCYRHEYNMSAMLQDTTDDRIRFTFLQGRKNSRHMFIESFNKKDYLGAVMLFGNFNSLAREYFCCLTLDKIAKKDWSKVFGEVYIMANHGSSFQRLLSDENLVELFTYANRKDLMHKSELNKLNSLPDRFSIYRGFSNEHHKIRFSWSLSKKVAIEFAHRYDKSSIIVCTAKREDVLAYFNDRKEEEIIVNPANIFGEVVLCTFYLKSDIPHKHL